MNILMAMDPSTVDTANMAGFNFLAGFLFLCAGLLFTMALRLLRQAGV